MKTYEELFGLAKELNEGIHTIESDAIHQSLDALEASVNDVKRSFSGSWLGYHSRVYYENLSSPPPGANFSQEWGLKRTISGLGSVGEWAEFDDEYVKQYVFNNAGNPTLDIAKKASEEANDLFSSSESEILSILTNELSEEDDEFISNLKSELENIKPLSKGEILGQLAPRGQVMTRDSLALSQGNIVPPHVDIIAEVLSVRQSFGICKGAATICQKAASHIERKGRRKKVAERIGTNVFIGHGQSTAWRELKDFIQGRVALPWDEFNRVPVAGVTNIARLSEMLDAAAIALLVMTAEDEMADGEVQARMNVIHEAGLFQGRLGFTKAIVLLEEGCEEFSNIQGLGQIRFPKGKISASFEEVRRVLEREGLLDTNENK